jgi:hypothetical protein
MININPHYLCTLAIFLTLSAVASPPQDTSIQRRVNELHHLIWRYYIQPETHLLLTRLDLAGKPLYVTGLRESPSIEDSSLCGGMYLDSLVQRYEITKMPGAAAQARNFYRGLMKNATVSPFKGLLARSLSPHLCWPGILSRLMTSKRWPSN